MVLIGFGILVIAAIVIPTTIVLKRKAKATNLVSSTTADLVSSATTGM